MRRTTLATTLPALALLATLGGCLASRPPLEPRFYVVPVSDELAGRPESDASLLNLGRVTPAPHLGERIVWRLTDVELAFDEQHRWATPPEAMVRDAVERACFASGLLRSTSDRKAPRLEMHLEAFEGRVEPREAVVTVRMSVEVDGEIHSQRIRRAAPLAATTADALAQALGALLGDLSSEAADWVGTRCSAGTPTPASVPRE